MSAASQPKCCTPIPAGSFQDGLQLETLAGAGTQLGCCASAPKSLVDDGCHRHRARRLPVKTQRRYVLLADVASNVVVRLKSACLWLARLLNVAQARPVLARLLHLHLVVPVPLRHRARSSGAKKVHQRRGHQTTRANASSSAPHRKVPCWYHPTMWQSRPGKAALPVAQEATARHIAHRGASAAPVRAGHVLSWTCWICPWTDPVLRASTELSSLPVEDPVKRAQASCGGKQLNASPEEVLREADRCSSSARSLRPCVT